MRDEIDFMEEDEAGRQGAGGVIFVTISALLMAMAVVAMPVWLHGRGVDLEMDTWLTFYGDLHPLLLHLPIGIFILVFLMEACGVLSFGKWKPQTTFPLFVGVVTAVLAVIAANFLHIRGADEDSATYPHVWGFTVFAVLGILTFVTKIWGNFTGAKSPIYGIMLVLTIGALCYTGAEGGILKWKEPFGAPMAKIFGKGADDGTPAVGVAKSNPGEEANKAAAAGPQEAPPPSAEAAKAADPARTSDRPRIADLAPAADDKKPAGDAKTSDTAPGLKQTEAAKSADPPKPQGDAKVAKAAEPSAPSQPVADAPKRAAPPKTAAKAAPGAGKTAGAAKPAAPKAPPKPAGEAAKPPEPVVAAPKGKGEGASRKPVPSRLAYEDVVKPILRSRCYECHADADENPLGKKKIKGSLVLTTIEDMKEGGSEAEALVPGDLENSLMHVRIHLPLDDDEHMPPDDKDQLAPHEIAILDWWIEAGAPTVSLKEAKAGPAILAAVKKLVPPEQLEKQRAAEAAAAAQAKAAEEERRKSLENAMAKASQEFPNALTFVSRESSDLQFTAVSMRQDFTDEMLAKLKAVGSGLVEVNLGATSVTDAGLVHLGAMPNLRKLHLQQTKVTDAGLDSVGKLNNLEWLNLFGTEITNDGLKKLESLPKLKKIYLWGSKVTPEGAEALKAKLPECEVNLGVGS